MTVIVIRDGIMATDSGVWQGDLCVGEKQKIFRLPNGSLFAACGRSPATEVCLDWLKRGEDQPHPPLEKEGDFGALWLREDGIFRISHDWMVYANTSKDFAADGAHGEFVLGALAHGASAAEAVELAIKYGDHAVGPVQTAVLAKSLHIVERDRLRAEKRAQDAETPADSAGPETAIEMTRRLNREWSQRWTGLDAR